MNVMDGLLIGRFQPFHLGHLDAVLFGLSRTENLFICIGSSNKSNESRNPFSAKERREMITSSIDPTIVIDPTQNKTKAVKNPSEKFSSFILNLILTLSNKFVITKSIS